MKHKLIDSHKHEIKVAYDNIALWSQYIIDHVKKISVITSWIEEIEEEGELNNNETSKL